jgi:hypothetical protein
MPQYGMETSNISSQKEVPRSTISVESDVALFWDGAQEILLEH